METEARGLRPQRSPAPPEASRAAPGAGALADNRPEAAAQRQLRQLMRSGAHAQAERTRLQGLFGPAAQLADVAGGPGSGPVQLVRAQLQAFQGQVDLPRLRAAVQRHIAETAEFMLDPVEEVEKCGADLNAITELQNGLATDLAALEALNPGARIFPTANLTKTMLDGDPALKLVVQLFRRMKAAREALNASLALRDEMRGSEQDQADLIGQKGAAKEEEARQREVARAGRRVPGLGAKWGQFRGQLAYRKVDTFHQYVPADSPTIQAALNGTILDAVWHEGKAFWMSDGRYELDSSGGKTRMEYTFTPAGARSLVEDFLICGSGDFAKDNDEPWVGESAHPHHTIWKANEIGAYGVGASRLRELAGSVASIKAIGANGVEIKARK